LVDILNIEIKALINSSIILSCLPFSQFIIQKSLKWGKKGRLIKEVGGAWRGVKGEGGRREPLMRGRVSWRG
jgi:hypothetical protein